MQYIECVCVCVSMYICACGDQRTMWRVSSHLPCGDWSQIGWIIRTLGCHPISSTALAPGDITGRIPVCCHSAVLRAVFHCLDQIPSALPIPLHRSSGYRMNPSPVAQCGNTLGMGDKWQLWWLRQLVLLALKQTLVMWSSLKHSPKATAV